MLAANDKDRSIVAEGIARYFADVKAVDGVDLNIESGRVFGFLGPNGSGKTTTVKMLSTILAPTGGTPGWVVSTWCGSRNGCARASASRSKRSVSTGS